MTAGNTVAIPEPRLERAGPDLWRITASVAGEDVFFESDVPLSPRPEVLVCPFLLPAMSQHADLEVSAPLSAGFLENLAFVRRRAIEWWPQFSAGEIRAPVGAATLPAPHSGLFYTGGADSSYCLQQLHPRLRYAVFIEGFDIKLDASERLRRARESLGATARACGVEFIVVRTNLRAHSLFRAVRWGIVHVSALAAVAHALAPHVQKMYVAASDVPLPWGSAPDLDAAWSSEAVKLENYSAELTRLQRVASIAHWELLRGRLRVCLRHNTTELNCGTCEKCLRTQMQLYVSGAPGGLDSFPRELPLRSTLGSLYEAHEEIQGQWREIASRLHDRGLLRQIDRLLQGRRQPLWRRGLRHLRRVATRTFRQAAAG